MTVRTKKTLVIVAAVVAGILALVGLPMLAGAEPAPNRRPLSEQDSSL